MASSNNIITITASTHFNITLTSQNFSVWRRHVQSTLIGLDLDNFITGATPAPPQTIADKTNPAYTPWFRQDQVIFSALLGSCSNEIQPLIASASTAKDAWDRLTSSFASKSRSRIISLKSKLATNPKGTRSVAEFLNEMRSIADELALVQSPVTEEDLMVHVLTQLGDEYTSIAAALKVRDTPVSYPELFDKLVDFERSLKLADPVNPIIATANATQRQHVRHPTRHFDSQNRNARTQSPVSSQRPSRSNKFQPGPSGNRANLFCNFCNILGHDTRECRKLARFLKDNHITFNNHSSNPVANAVTSNPGSQRWMMDSGASHHLTSCPATLSSVSEYGGPDEIVLGDALLKQQGVGPKGKEKNAPVIEEVVPPLLEPNGKLEVWSIDGGAKNPVAREDVGKFYSGDCYIVLYSYHSREKKEDFYLCYWIGKDSTEEDQNTAAKLTTSMFNSLKGRPVQGRIYQEKEPPQFVAIFQPMVLLKGGLSSSYKSHIADKGITDETYSPDTASIIRISGTAVHNNKAIHLDPVPASLNSHECFVVHAGNHLYIWQGTQSTYEQQQWAVKIADFLKPGVTAKYQKEGTESATFWLGLGGKENVSTNKVALETIRDPHVFSFSLAKGKFEVEEVYNFDQDDLLPEDILILDTHAEVFVWVGQAVDAKEKKSALEYGQKYIDWAEALDGLNARVPLYRVPEGNEPNFFTTYFSWEPLKTMIHGNSFQKKITILFGAGHESSGNQGGGNTQRASALAALNSTFNSSGGGGGGGGKGPTKGSSAGSQRRAAVAALSGVLTNEKIEEPAPDSPEKPEEPPEEPVEPSEPIPEEDDSEPKVAIEEDENGILSSQSTFSYEQVRVKSEDPVPGIDLKRREAYLSTEEFESYLGMTREDFYKLPKWKQDITKKKVDLF